MSQSAPLILTLHFDPASQARFEAERKRYFPPERNKVPAHLTLFHQLPDSEFVRQTLAETARAQCTFSVMVTGLRSLGGGVAYSLASPPLGALHGRLAAAFDVLLIPQDRQPFRPHVVVQNKVRPETARLTLVELSRDFAAFSAQAVGLDLWLYGNGLWTLQKFFTFAPLSGSAS